MGRKLGACGAGFDSYGPGGFSQDTSGIQGEATMVEKVYDRVYTKGQDIRGIVQGTTRTSGRGEGQQTYGCKPASGGWVAVTGRHTDG